MEKTLNQIYQDLQRLIGLHRQLLDVVRLEREALISVDIKAIQEVTSSKQALIYSIQQFETDRMKHVGELAVLWKKPVRDLTLSNIAIAIQGSDLKSADLFRTSLNTLTLLIQRISEQNSHNKTLVENSLEHVNEMKKNVLGETVPHSNTYTANGQKSGSSSGARFISKEA